MVQFLKKDELHMFLITDDVYVTWISAQPYGVKLSYHGRFFKFAFQWGKNGTKPDAKP